MKLDRTYHQIRFPTEVIQEATEILFANLEGTPSVGMRVQVDEGQWMHDSEQEFFADYRRSSGTARFSKELSGHSIWIQTFSDSVAVEVEAPTRAKVLEVFEVFERNLNISRLPEPPEAAPTPPTVFIGHGRSALWRDLKDHLQDKHGVKIEAYEMGARAGHTIRDILQDMLVKSSFALLVMTGEDEISEGVIRARQNVIHEAGLFQGRLGFSRAIILFEEGTEEFSNIKGIEQIRFSSGNIKETFGEVLATLRREFGVNAV